MTVPQPCPRHPREQTTLRCSKCETPICPRCAVLTPVGYRCPECGREKSVLRDVPLFLHLIGIGMGGVLGWLVIGVVPRGFLLFTLLLGVGAGALMGELLSRVLQRKRSLWVAFATTFACLVGLFYPLVREILETSGAVTLQELGKALLKDISRLAFVTGFGVMVWQRIG